jgi:hypothetical protein
MPELPENADQLKENGGEFLSTQTYENLRQDSALGDQSVVISKAKLQSMLKSDLVHGLRLRLFQNADKFEGIQLVASGTDAYGNDMYRVPGMSVNMRDCGKILTRSKAKEAIDDGGGAGNFTFGSGPLRRILASPWVSALDFAVVKGEDGKPTIVIAPVVEVPLRTVVINDLVYNTPPAVEALTTVVINDLVYFEAASGTPVHAQGLRTIILDEIVNYNNTPRPKPTPQTRTTIVVEMIVNLAKGNAEAELHFTELDALIAKKTGKRGISHCVVGAGVVNAKPEDFQASKQIPSMGDLITKKAASELIANGPVDKDSKYVRVGRNLLEMVLSCDEVKAVRVYLAKIGGVNTVVLFPVISTKTNTVYVDEIINLTTATDDTNVGIIHEIYQLEMDGDKAGKTTITELKKPTRKGKVVRKPAIVTGVAMKGDQLEPFPHSYA